LARLVLDHGWRISLKRTSVKPRLNWLLWTLPFLGFALGYAYAYVSYHGLLETWHFVGKPGENIAQILGVREARDLLVATETGRIFSVGFADGGEVSFSFPPRWEQEGQDSSDPVNPLEYYGADFYTVPPLFQVAQPYEMENIYRWEGKGAVKFALASSGNLWMWSRN
jgi:hypothetical protein